MICDPWAVVVVPFPFTEREGAKRRPALVLSRVDFNAGGNTVLAMITTRQHAPWPGDAAIERPDPAGLRAPSIVRMKLFTLDNRIIIQMIGRLAEVDRESVTEQLRRHLA